VFGVASVAVAVTGTRANAGLLGALVFALVFDTTVFAVGTEAALSFDLLTVDFSLLLSDC